MAVLGWMAISSAVACRHGPIDVVVPFPAGGSLDNVVRVVAEGAARATGRHFIVHNLAGGTGIIGVQHVLRGEADGCTVLAGTFNTMVLAPHAIASAKYSLEDFAPIGLLGYTQYILLAHPSVPADDLAGLVRAADGRPHAFSFGHPGSDSIQHLGMSLLARTLGFPVLAVPYKGSAPMLKDLSGGHIELAVVAKPAAAMALERGTVKKLANISEWAETHHPRNRPFPGWAAWFVPRGTPPQQIGWLQAAFQRAIERPDVVRRLDALDAPAATALERRSFMANHLVDAGSFVPPRDPTPSASPTRP